MKKRIIILLVVIICNIVANNNISYAQKNIDFVTEEVKKVPIQRREMAEINNKTINSTQFLTFLTTQNPSITNENAILVVKNVNVIFDEKIDRKGVDERFADENAPMLTVYHDISLDYITFDTVMWSIWNKLTFKGNVIIGGCQNVKAIFKNCIFEMPLRIASNQINFFEFKNCDFQHGFRYHLNTLTDFVKFEKCKFALNPAIQDDTRMSVFDKFVIEAHLFEFKQKGDAIDFVMQDCTFDIPKRNKNLPKYAVNISETHFTNLQMVNNKYETNVNLAQATVENQFLFMGGNLNGAMIIDAFNINPLNTRVQWSILSDNKISVYDSKKALISGKERENIKDEVVFSNLISCYATFYGLFRAQGNRTYANSSYIEWKNIETSYLYNLYQKDNKTSVFFGYLMNIFLRDFCDYGTNPLKSIYLSSIVLLGFAFFYFISPFQLNADKDENGKFQQKSVFSHLKLYAIYLTQHDKLKNIYLKTKNLQQLKEDKRIFLDLAKTNKEQLPLFFSFIAFPLDWWHKKQDSFMLWFYDKIDFFPEKWEDLPTKKRFFAGILVGILLIFAFLYFALVRAIDAFTLSLNVFSTLGFGEIPVKGVIRYLTVLEGFIGWFLLSIFSVSLISQVIQ